jgi:maltose O-acetyltransferase
VAESQKQRMLAGELYDARDPELVAGRLHARRFLDRFNASSAGEGDLRRSLLRALFEAFGEGAVVEPSFRCDYGYNIRMGRGAFVNYDCVFLDCNTIDIGDGAQIGPAVQVYTADHPLDPRTRRSGLESARPVRIGDNVWLGGGAIVCPGVTIGADTVVGAGSVVVRDLPPGVVAAGNPCRLLRPLPPGPRPAAHHSP